MTDSSIVINLLVEVAFGGKVTTTVYERQKRFAVLVRYPQGRRDSIRALERALVHSPAGYNVPLGELAEVTEVEAPAQISREDSRRRVLVECNVRGRDMGGFVKEAKAACRTGTVSCGAGSSRTRSAQWRV